MPRFFTPKTLIILAGLIMGVLGALLVKWGNPPNMGICVACFIRDIAGALGLHQASAVQYIRPEIPGLLLGAFITAFVNRGHSKKIVSIIIQPGDGYAIFYDKAAICLQGINFSAAHPENVITLESLVGNRFPAKTDSAIAYLSDGKT